MKNKIIKIILICLTVLISVFNYNAYAISNPLEDPSLYTPGLRGSETELVEMTRTILGIVNTVGIVASVIILMVVGIKYMTGSIEEKAEYKKTASAYVLGAMLLFGITTIANILYQIGTSRNSI